MPTYRGNERTEVELTYDTYPKRVVFSHEMEEMQCSANELLLQMQFFALKKIATVTRSDPEMFSTRCDTSPERLKAGNVLEEDHPNTYLSRMAILQMPGDFESKEHYHVIVTGRIVTPFSEEPDVPLELVFVVSRKE